MKTAIEKKTERVNIGDSTCGMSEHPALLLSALSRRELTVPEFTWIDTTRFLNCREQGFVIQVRSPTSLDKQLNLAFFTHRNSDTLCALRWTGVGHISVGVRPDDVPEAAFPDKWTHAATWPFMEILAPVEWTEKQICEYLGIEEE